MAQEQFGWIDFYTELATKLLEFKADRPLLIRKLQQVYSNIEMKMPKLAGISGPGTIIYLLQKYFTLCNGS